jgi:hypothetical protein
MYGAAGEKRPIFLESDAFLYNLDDPTFRKVLYSLPTPAILIGLVKDVGQNEFWSIF